MTQKTLHMKTGGVDITAELFSPATAGGKYPLVVLAYGTGGMMAPFDRMYLDFAQGLAQAGFGCLLPNYLAQTNTAHNLEMLELLPSCKLAWVTALRDAIATGTAFSEVDATRLALGGFSLGGNLMLHAAQSVATKAFIDFFAPIVTIDPVSVVTEGMAAKLPPTLLHHGKADSIVPYSDSVLMEGWLKKAGVRNDLTSYPAQGHPSPIEASSWSAKTQVDSLASTVSFLQLHLR